MARNSGPIKIAENKALRWMYLLKLMCENKQKTQNPTTKTKGLGVCMFVNSLTRDSFWKHFCTAYQNNTESEDSSYWPPLAVTSSSSQLSSRAQQVSAEEFPQQPAAEIAVQYALLKKYVLFPEMCPFLLWTTRAQICSLDGNSWP